MNRNAEYERLMQELDTLTVPVGGVERALRRERRNRYLLRPLMSIAAVFALFVILVNVSTTVAYACSRVPGLRELAAAVTFSRSLSDAVANEYVQPINLSETNEDITVKVEYLIVDQRNVTVFYRMESKCYPQLEATPDFYAADGSEFKSCSWGANDWDVPNGELRSVHLGFLYDDVPSAVRMKLKLRDMTLSETSPAPMDSIWDDIPTADNSKYIAEFEFLLEFDPYFTAQGKHFETDESIALGEHTLRITSVDVYPTYLSFDVLGDETNTAWLKSLGFYLVTDAGERFEPVSNGIAATGNPDTPEMMSFRADSTFFYHAKTVTLYVTKAEWLDKDAETIHVDLKNARADTMPEGSELISCKHEGSRWVVTVLQGRTDAQVFMSEYYDADGNEYFCHSWTSGATRLDGTDTEAPEGYSYDSFPLNNYPYDEVWLTPRYTSRWSSETPVAVTVPLA